MEWLLHELQHNHPDAFQVVDSVLARMPTLHMFSNDILLLIFQHVALGSVKHIPLVCKRWHRLFQTPAFWQPRINAAIRAVVPTKDYPMPNLWLFRFCQLYHKVGWLFYRPKEVSRVVTHVNRACIYVADGDYISIQLPYFKSDSHCQIQIRFRKDDYLVMNYGYNAYDSDGNYGWNDNGLYHRIHLVAQSGIVEEWGNYVKPTKQEKDVEIIYKLEDGTLFRGSAMKHETKGVIPHGAGTWRFPDGTTLSGDHVAFDGVPHDGDTWFAGERRRRRKKIKRNGEVV